MFESAADVQPIVDPQEAAEAAGLRYVSDARRPGPALIEAVVDPNEPPLPPKATFEQAKHLVEALARGTPHAGTRAQHRAREDP